MAEKVTVMVLKVDLECPCCYKKVKKILCKFPQIRDQIYNEKANKVTITVVCCDPEKIRDTLCCKGAKVIKSIEIVDPPKPPPAQPPEKPIGPPPAKPPEKPIAPGKPKEIGKPEDIKEPIKPDKKVTFVDPPKKSEKPKEAPKPDPPKAPVPAPTPPPPEPIMGPGPCGYPPVYPVRTCCGPCSEGYGGGPCYFGYGVAAPPPQPCYDGYYGYGHHESPRHVTRCDYYFSEENPQACSIM